MKQVETLRSPKRMDKRKEQSSWDQFLLQMLMSFRQFSQSVFQHTLREKNIQNPQNLLQSQNAVYFFPIFNHLQ